MEKEIKELLDDCYNAIAQAIYHDDGLDGAAGQELLDKIKKVIPEGKYVVLWSVDNGN